jgi:hypothetical protein
MDNETWNRLRDRRQFATAGTDEEKWVVMFRTIFPSAKVPSPCKSNRNSTTRH